MQTTLSTCQQCYGKYTNKYKCCPKCDRHEHEKNIYKAIRIARDDLSRKEYHILVSQLQSVCSYQADASKSDEAFKLHKKLLGNWQLCPIRLNDIKSYLSVIPPLTDS